MHYPNHRRAAESLQSAHYIYLPCSLLKAQQEAQYVLPPPIIAFHFLLLLWSVTNWQESEVLKVHFSV